jgi:hypothetical protein
VIPTRNLMIRLQERTHSLYSAPEATFGPQVRHFVQWLESEPVFATSLAELPHIELSAEEWLQQNVKYGEGLNVSAEEDKAVAELWQVVLHLAAQENVTSAAFKTGRQLPSRDR